MVFMAERRRPSAELLRHLRKARAARIDCLRLCRKVEVLDDLRALTAHGDVGFRAVLKAEAEWCSAELRAREADYEQICRDIADVARLCGDTEKATRWTAEADAIAARLNAEGRVV
jgi:hypothetical protein